MTARTMRGAAHQVISPAIVDEALGVIERLELKSLQWGYVEGSLSVQDLDVLITGVLANHTAPHLDSGKIVEALIDHGLLFELPQPDHTNRYRSRFAEGVRL